jgi:hypothetical protein
MKISLCLCREGVLEKVQIKGLEGTTSDPAEFAKHTRSP